MNKSHLYTYFCKHIYKCHFIICHIYRYCYSAKYKQKKNVQIEYCYPDCVDGI